MDQGYDLLIPTRPLELSHSPLLIGLDITHYIVDFEIWPKKVFRNEDTLTLYTFRTPWFWSYDFRVRWRRFLCMTTFVCMYVLILLSYCNTKTTLLYSFEFIFIKCLYICTSRKRIPKFHFSLSSLCIIKL